jgi:hypothetical protein
LGRSAITGRFVLRPATERGTVAVSTVQRATKSVVGRGKRRRDNEAADAKT